MSPKEIAARNRKSEQLKVLETDDGQFFVESEKGIILDMLTANHLTYELARAAEWFKIVDGEEVPDALLAIAFFYSYCIGRWIQSTRNRESKMSKTPRQRTCLYRSYQGKNIRILHGYQKIQSESERLHRRPYRCQNHLVH